MNVVIKNKPNKSDKDGVSFPALQCWNPVTEVATIAAEVSGRRVSCRISVTVLRKKFTVSSEDPMQAITENRAQIESAAKRLIENKDFEEDGSIIISSEAL
ncbi:MAG: DUF1488 family protein [Gammaproteobacteria bacterium]|nr:DUF1488 family protein [Gammaproteobacteria bacterium]